MMPIEEDIDKDDRNEPRSPFSCDLQWPSYELRKELPWLGVPKRPSMLDFISHKSRAFLQGTLHSEMYPMQWHEPLTELQRRLEGAQYCYLLNQVHLSNPPAHLAQ